MSEAVAVSELPGLVRAQALKNGYQDELPDIWLTNGNPWEIARPGITYRIGFYGTVDQFKWSPAEQVRQCPPQASVDGLGQAASKCL